MSKNNNTGSQIWLNMILLKAPKCDI